MRKVEAIEKAGSQLALSKLCGVTESAVSQWGETLPQARVWQLRLLRPEWFPGVRQDAMEVVVLNSPPAANDMPERCTK